VANYRIAIKRSAAKELEELPTKDRRRIVRKIRRLGDEPRPPGCEKLSAQERYRLRQGDYRILYEVDDEDLLVTVVRIGHRGDVYR
jgi:mRNA interferase RelE/StbE